MKSCIGFLAFHLCWWASVLLIILLSLLIVSCDLWNKDMLGYLEYWSETVQMGRVEVSDATIQKNDAGADTIPVAATPTIAAYVINPKSYELLAEIGDSSSADKSVRVSDSAVQSKTSVVAHEATLLKVQLGSADGSLEHTEFRVDFEAIRKDTMQSSGQVMGVTLRYNTPPVAPTPVVWSYDSSQHEVVKAGEKWEADRDGILYWAYDDSITKETDPNCAKWFSINGTRHPVAGCKVPDVQVDGLSVFQFNTNYSSTSVAAVDSEGVSSPAVASGQAVPPATYVIKYDGNGADGGTAPTSQSKTQYTDITLAANVGNLTKIGYKFSGWNTRADGTGTTYLAGATYSADESVTLYAKWEAVDAVVLTPESSAVNHGATVTLTPPKSDATIYYQIGGADEVAGTPGQTVTVTLYNANHSPSSATGVVAKIPEGGEVIITAYAKYADDTQSEETTGTYSLNKYAVRYEGNGNTSGDVPAEQSFYSGGSVTVQGKDNLTKTGYTFTGWQGDDGQPYSQGYVYGGNEDLTLTAQWQANTYTVTFVNDGASGGSVTATYDQPLPSVQVPTKTDYTFGGYFDGPDGTGKQYYDHKGEGLVPWTETSGITLYAKFSHEPNQDDNGTYEVANVGNLLWIGQQLKSGAFKKVSLKLTADIVIPSGEWVPIDLPDGSPSTFDGQGHSITFDSTSGGLFVDFNYSTIENLVLKGNITGNSAKGALLNSAYCTVIRNVMSLVTIANTGTGATGGLVGTFGGRDRNGQVSTIENCAVYADVSSNGYAGGLVGELWEKNQYGMILNSVYMGTVSGSKAGAVVGYNASYPSSPSTLENIYYCVTNNSNIAVIGDTGAGGTFVNKVDPKTEDEIKAGGLGILGASWEAGSDGLPTLKKNP